MCVEKDKVLLCVYSMLDKVQAPFMSQEPLELEIVVDVQVC